MQSAPVREESHIGPLIRRWRTARGKSQLDLALSSKVSQRHVSFIESGRSVPSRAMVINLAEALDVPFRDRNTLLLAAGYAPTYHETQLDEPEAASVNSAIERMLVQQEPFPAILMDRHWNVVKTNKITPLVFGKFVDLDSIPRPRNLLRLVFDPSALRSHIDNWESLARSLVARVHREAVGHSVDETTKLLLAELMRYPSVKSDWQRPDSASNLPIVPLGLIHNGSVIRYFSMVCTVGTPQTILTQELRLECMFPADPQSNELHMKLISG